ncbi:hypothetical protein ABZ281_03635 [Streptomyces sp. NPDC006265]|uniref:hypothetical protein n=1 Tax=Streptomyces sp. NPDC006265 TaxID=3156740 RepID=UPI0033A2C903
MPYTVPGTVALLDTGSLTATVALAATAAASSALASPVPPGSATVRRAPRARRAGPGARPPRSIRWAGRCRAAARS